VGKAAAKLNNTATASPAAVGVANMHDLVFIMALPWIAYSKSRIGSNGADSNVVGTWDSSEFPGQGVS